MNDPIDIYIEKYINDYMDGFMSNDHLTFLWDNIIEEKNFIESDVKSSNIKLLNQNDKYFGFNSFEKISENISINPLFILFYL